MVNVLPAIVISPERDEQVVFSSTLYVTVPLPVPDAPPVIVTQDKLSVAVQSQQLKDAATATVLPVSPAAPTDADAGVRP